MEEERSESGDRIYRYDGKDAGWSPPNMDDSSMELIEKHVEQHIGEIGSVWHEIISDKVHIDVHQVAPTKDRPYWTLITTGMSDIPMISPESVDGWDYAELMICLPEGWKFDEESLKDERYYWPIRWLKILARFPHDYKTWLSYGHTMPNGDPAEPIYQDGGFSCMMLMRPKTVSTDFWRLQIRDDKIIHFFSLIPLYSDETELKLREGSEIIDDLFEEKKITELFDPDRQSVVKKSWWRFW